MSTIAPANARRIGAALEKRRIYFLDAPVTGSSPKAEDGTLTIMAGWDTPGRSSRRPWGATLSENDFAALIEVLEGQAGTQF